MPNAGINTMGASEVAGIGIASVAHQAASSIIRPAAFQAASLMPSGAGNNRVMTSSATPASKPTSRLVVQPSGSDWFVVVADILFFQIEFLSLLHLCSSALARALPTISKAYCLSTCPTE